MERLLILILFSAISLLACSRQVDLGGRSVISIQVPAARDVASKTGGVGAMSAMPSDRKACYGINVSGPGIGSQANTCHPGAGVMAGFVEPGGTLEVAVSKGAGRKIELFAYLQNVGDNLPCPAFNPGMTGSILAATYKVGVAENVDVAGDETHVTITADFPGVANTVASQLNLPSSCATPSAPVGNRPGFTVGASGGSASNGSKVLTARIGAAASGQSASNGSIVLMRK